MEIERMPAAQLRVVLPGEKVDMSSLSGQVHVNDKTFSVSAETITAKCSGVIVNAALAEDKGTWMTIQQQPTKYYAQVNDYVIGVVKGRVQEYYIVDISAQEDALLSFQGFEGATKKNRPNLRDGSVVFCKVTEVSKYMKLKIDCIHPKNKKQWMTEEAFFGQLKEGMLANISINQSKAIIEQGDFVFRAFRKHLKQFETSVGVNGKVWIKTKDPQNTVLILHALKQTENFTSSQITAFVDSLAPAIKKELV